MARNTWQEDEDLDRPFNALTLTRLAAYFKPYKAHVAFAVVLMIIASMLGLAGPWLVMIAIDQAIPHHDVPQLLRLALILLACVVAGAWFLRLRIRIMTRIGQDVIHEVRANIFRRLQVLPFTYFDTRPHGKILVRVVNYVNALSDLLSNGFINLVSDLFSLVFIVVLMLLLDVRLTLLCMAGVPVLVVVIFALKGLQRRSWQAMSAKQSNLNAWLHEALSGVRITQSFARENAAQATFEDLGETWRKSWMKAVMAIFLTWPVIEIVSVLSTCLVYVAGASWYRNTLTIGALLAFIGYIWRFWQPVVNIGNFWNALVQAAAYLERVFETIDEPTDEQTAEQSKKPTDKPGYGSSDSTSKHKTLTLTQPVAGRIEFRDVDFSYEPGRPVLRHVSFSVDPGQTIAIVGPTGAGKTTVVNLLSRFYTAEHGSITIDGIDITRLNVADLRRCMGVMLQDSVLFSGSIRDNIRYGCLSASDAEVEAAARSVHAHEFIVSLSQGYDTLVQEHGSRLSTGQRQLISFARTLLSNPAILILDEATSSVDTETERAIRRGMESLTHGRTSIVIAHRLSTIRNAGCILFVDKGTIVEAGTHEQLVAKRGAYWRLYASD